MSRTERPEWGPGWTREQWREHCRQWSQHYKKINLRNPPSQKGTKFCPRCEEEKSRKEFAIALRQPDGLRQYCNDCNRVIVRTWYWTQRLRKANTRDQLAQAIERASIHFSMRALRQMVAGTKWEGSF